MQKILNQEEIDALFQRARGGQGSSKQRHVTKCDFRSAGQITKEQLRLLTGLHETFARNLIHTLSAYYRLSLEMRVVSVEQLTYSEFFLRMPEMAYFATLKLNEMSAIAGLNLEMPIIYPILDALLGGKGRPEPHLRELTEIEQGIIANLMGTVIRELNSCWQGLGLSFNFERRLASDEVSDMISPTERVLTISFELRMPESQAMFNIILPSTVATVLQRLLQKTTRRQSNAAATQQIQGRMMNSDFLLELSLPTVRVRSSELLALEPGKVLMLPHKVDEPVCLTVAGQQLFSAFPVARNHSRSAYIHKTAIPEGNERRREDGSE